MISFKVFNEENLEEVVTSVAPTEDLISEISELASSFSFDIPDLEFALSYAHGCALVRVFDMGRYSFLYPYVMTEGADPISAIDEMCEYAMREEIKFVVDDVPKECVCDFLSFRHMDVDARDPLGESFRITVKTECDLMGDIPEVKLGRVELNSLAEADITEYARLSKDKNVNKYWGYNYSEDATCPEDEYFYEIAMNELSSGISVTMAIRCEGVFVGEAIIYAFDGRGRAEFAIRLLPEWQGKGIGTEGVRAICLAAEELGLVRISSRIMKENLPSIRMLEKVTDDCEDDGKNLVFHIDLSVM